MASQLLTSLVGSRILESRLIDGLDDLNAADFASSKLTSVQTLLRFPPAVLEERLRNVNS